MMNLPDRPSLAARRGATTLWRMVSRSLEVEIQEGSLSPGARLPSEFELATRFEVHRNTIRRALSVLRDRNLIRVEQGRGAFVKERLVVHELGATTRLNATLSSIHRMGERRFIATSRVRLDRDVARSLQTAPGQFARRVDTVTVVDGTVIATTSSFFPLPRFEGIERSIKETGSFTAAWKKYGIEHYQRLEVRVSSAALSRADAMILGRPRGQPVTVLTNVNVDAEGKPIVWSKMRILPQHMELTVKFD